MNIENKNQLNAPNILFGFFDLSFAANQSELSTTNIFLSVWPSYHEHTLKEMTFEVVKSNSSNNTSYSL